MAPACSPPISHIRSNATPLKSTWRERFQQFRFDHEKPRAGIVQDVPKLRPARGDIDRHRDGAKPGAAEIGFEKFRRGWST